MNSHDGDKKQLPVVPPAADELLSLWIVRHGAFYNVSPRAMLRHAVPNTRSLSAADDHITEEQGDFSPTFQERAFRHLSHDLRQYPELGEALYRGGGNSDMSKLRSR